VVVNVVSKCCGNVTTTKRNSQKENNKINVRLSIQSEIILKKGFINDSLWFISRDFSDVVNRYETKGVNLVEDCIDFIKFQQSIEKM
jgi:hypothetical protein